MSTRSTVHSRSDADHAGAVPAARSRGLKLLREVSLAVAVYGMLGWIYVAICALTAPYTLALPLTHLVPWLREDTSGVISFVLSFAAFVLYRMARSDGRPS
jgi:hypothetical protein